MAETVPGRKSPRLRNSCRSLVRAASKSARVRDMFVASFSEYTYILRFSAILACLAFSPFLCRAPSNRAGGDGAVDPVVDCPIRQIAAFGISDGVEGIGIGVNTVPGAEEKAPLSPRQRNKPTVWRNVSDARVRNGRGIVESADRAKIREVDAVGRGSEPHR